MLAKGDMPCDILYVAEAPGVSENARGLPLVGPAGKVQDAIIADAMEAANVPGLTWAFLNLLGCIPLDEQGIDKVDPTGHRRLLLRVAMPIGPRSLCLPLPSRPVSNGGRR